MVLIAGFYRSHFWSWEVQDQDAVSWQGLSAWLAEGHSLTVFSHGGERSMLCGASFYKDTNPITRVAPLRPP